MAKNSDGVVVVSPQWVRQCPTIAEVRAFYQIDPEMVSPLANVYLARLVEEGLVRLGEVDDMEAFAGMSTAAAERALGRAELRALTRRAQALGKKVISDLVLMQSSRYCPLIEEHPEWYQLDENDAPRVHEIAWLVYFDVALFDLVYNRPLRDHLLEVPPYSIE